MGGQSKYAGNVEVDIWEDEKRSNLSSIRSGVRRGGAMRCFTFREEPISMLDDGLNDGHHVDRCSCCYLRQRPGQSQTQT